MNIQNLMKLAAQNAEEQKQAQDFQNNMQTQRRLIMSVMINDKLKIDEATEKVIRLLKAKGIKGDDLEILTSLANLAKAEVKGMLNNTKKLMEDIK